MANIMISDLQATDLSLSSDGASYLKDLNATEQNIEGGLGPVQAIAMIMMGFGVVGVGVAAGVMAARAWDKI